MTKIGGNLPLSFPELSKTLRTLKETRKTLKIRIRNFRKKNPKISTGNFLLALLGPYWGGFFHRPRQDTDVIQTLIQSLEDEGTREEKDLG